MTPTKMDEFGDMTNPFSADDFSAEAVLDEVLRKERAAAEATLGRLLRRPREFALNTAAHGLGHALNCEHELDAESFDSTPLDQLGNQRVELIDDHGVLVRVFRASDGSVDEAMTFGRLID
ncbi:hypothetical protein ACIBM3_22875 [Rhodococcus erythropolis]|uniref:hypothetical protein n=1 Tax=Rhodococcus erythropolis TaxID=1833 RepID=UPI0037AD81DB